MRFSLLGVPVSVRPAFWLVGLLFGAPLARGEDAMMRVAMWMGILFVSILVHELGHAFAMRAVGRTPSIELWGMGGLTRWGDGPRVSGWKRAAVSLAGPCAGFALAVPIVLAAIFAPPAEGSVAAQAIELGLLVNVGWGALNLLPILPLDGGHVMEVALAGMAGDRGLRLARFVSIGFAVGAAGLALYFEMPIAAFLAFFFGMQSVRQLGAPPTDAAIPARAPIDPEVDRALTAAWEAIRQGRAAEAIAACEEQLAALPEGEANAPIRARAIETIAWAHLEDGEDGDALRAAKRMPARFAPSALLAARLLLAEGKYDEGIRALERAYQDTPGDLPGLVLAAAYVGVQRPDRAVSMLRSLRGARLTTHAHLTVSAALFYDEHYEDALAVSDLAWNRFRDPTHAYNAACSCAKLGRIDAGLEWVRTAVTTAGFRETEKLETDDDLAPLRADPRWREIVAPSVSEPRPS